MSVEKTNLMGLTIEQMEAFCLSIGEKKFRAQQLMKWIHHQQEDDFTHMTDLSKSLREKLAEIAEVRLPRVITENISRDGTRKWALEVDGGGAMEMVFIPDGRRGTLCVSSQVGCAVDCSFCSTGKQGFQRDLTAAEIVGQIWLAGKSFGPRKNLGQHPVTNVVMMGMGEPLLNYDNVVNAMRVMLDNYGYGISKRRITLSTSGVVPMMDKLREDIDVSLAVSLHAPNDALRNELVPLNRKYPLAELLAACDRYSESRTHKHNTITMEYVMLRGVNDQLEHARQLEKLLKGRPVKVNLIPFNPFPHSGYETSLRKDVLAFHQYLNDRGVITTVRTTRGDDIDAACGQLVGAVKDKTRRNERWQKSIFLRTEQQGAAL